jgi:hypothetical protein
VADILDSDPIPALRYNEFAVRACLGCLSSSPQDVASGDWVLLIMDKEDQPLGLSYVGLVFDKTNAPISDAIKILKHAGYRYEPTIGTKPWAAEWKIIRS